MRPSGDSPEAEIRLMPENSGREGALIYPGTVPQT